MKKIYCPEITRKRNIKEFLNEYFEKNCPATIYEDGTLDCGSGKHRSIESLYYLTKTEYPSISFKRFIKVISKLAVERKACIFPCAHINKMTFFRKGDAHSFNFSFRNDNDFVRNKYTEVGIYHNSPSPIGEYKDIKALGKYTNYDLFKIVTND